MKPSLSTRRTTHLGNGKRMGGHLTYDSSRLTSLTQEITMRMDAMKEHWKKTLELQTAICRMASQRSVSATLWWEKYAKTGGGENVTWWQHSWLVQLVGSNSWSEPGRGGAFANISTLSWPTNTKPRAIWVWNSKSQSPLQQTQFLEKGLNNIMALYALVAMYSIA